MGFSIWVGTIGGGWPAAQPHAADKHGHQKSMPVIVPCMMCSAHWVIACCRRCRNNRYTRTPALLAAAPVIQGLSVGGEYWRQPIYDAEVAVAEGRKVFTRIISVCERVDRRGNCWLYWLSHVGFAYTMKRRRCAHSEVWGWRIPFGIKEAVLLAVVALRGYVVRWMGNFTTRGYAL